MRRIFVLLLAAAACAPAHAQTNAELLERLQAMEARMKAMEAELQQLRGQQAAAVPAAPAPAPGPQAVPGPTDVAATPGTAAGSPLPNYGGAQGAAAKVFNPDISVIADFLGATGNGGARPTPSLEMHESEVGFQAIIDPYARADFFISFGEQGVDLEEGYITFPALPGGFQLRAGKMRASFGKVNTLHNHVLPWTDRPLVTANLAGGEEGISDAGLSVSRILPAPGGLFLEGIAQVFRGDSEGVFQAYRRSNVSIVDRLHAYRDLGESTNLDFGLSYARGHSPLGENHINQLYSFDATVRWKPLRRSIYRSFIGRTEFIWNRAGTPDGSQTPYGYYVSGDYQLSRRWFAGARFDRSERVGTPLLRDTGGSALLTFWPSEFSQIRGQMRRTRYAEGLTGNEFLFQFLFSIGAHGAHPF